MKFASQEIREKAVRAYIEGKGTAKQLAEIFGYTRATICSWVRAYRKTEQLAPKPNGHRRKCFSETEIEELKALLAEKRDMTLEEIRVHFNKSCCLSAVHRMLVKLGYRYKKTLKASEQEREDVKEKRKAWKIFQEKVECSRLIFLDETGAKTNMTRLYGRALRGERCNDHAPDGRWERTTILSALKQNGETCSAVFEGALDAKMYNAYIEKFLLPTLNPGDILIMDNLSVHKSEVARKLVEEKGCEYVPLPEYSPDLNPIEKMWSKIKQILRGIKARSRDELDKAIGFALECVTPEDAEGWFASCGYIKN